MAAQLEAIAFTLIPLLALGAGASYAVASAYHLDDQRPLLLGALLLVMFAHQVSEVSILAANATAYQTTVSEVTETAVNLLATISTYVVLGYIKRERTLREGLAVFNRVLRHDLRNHLNVVLGNVEQARLYCDEEADTPLDTAADTAESLLGKADTARDLQSIFEEKQSLHAVPLGKALEDEVESARSRFADATFTLDAPGDTSVLADASLHTVFEGLLENAVVHNDKPNPEVDVWVEDRRWRVVVYIADNGPGIPPSERELALGRSEPTRDHVHHGEGLSLFFIDRVVQAYGGDVRIEANQPEGAVFEISLRKPHPLINA